LHPSGEQQSSAHILGLRAPDDFGYAVDVDDLFPEPCPVATRAGFAFVGHGSLHGQLAAAELRDQPV
jgi:hypothetical protein